MPTLTEVPEVAKLLATIVPGEPVTHGALTVIPLLAPDSADPDWLTLDDLSPSPQGGEGRVRGEAASAHITEVSEAGAVPLLKVTNDTPRPLLLLDGEELIGAKQNRVLNTTVLVTVLGGCGLSTSDGPTPIAQENVPPELQEGDTTVTTVAPGGDDLQTVEIWFLRTDGDMTVLEAVQRTVPWPANATRVLETLFDQGPTEEERAQGFSTAIPTDARLSGQPQTLSNVLEVSLSDATYDGLSGANSSNAFAQIVFTVTQLEGIDFVQFMLDGEPVPVPDGLGKTRTEPLDRGDYDNLITP